MGHRRRRRSRRSRPSATRPSSVGASERAPPFSRQCSTTPAAVSAPRARTARSASSRRRSASSGHGRREHLRRQHALGQVVEPLEALASGDGEPAACSRAARASPSPASSSTSHRRRSRRSGASRAGRDRRSRPGSPRPGADVSARPRRTSVGRRFASRPKSGQSSTGRRQASCAQYSKILPEPSSDETAPVRVVADPRRQHQAVAALDRRDRVELHAREPPDRGLDLGRAARAGSGPYIPVRRRRAAGARRCRP